MNDGYYIKTEAFLLFCEDIRSSSERMVFFSPSEGRMNLEFKGFYKARGSEGVVLSPGCEYEVVCCFPRERGNGLVKEMNLLSLPPLPGIAGLRTVHHFSEFLMNIQTESGPEHAAVFKIFKSLMGILRELPDEPLRRSAAVLACEVLVLWRLGFVSGLEACSSCGRNLTGKENVFFSLKETSFVCSACRAEKGEILPFTKKLASFLKDILSGQMTPSALKKLVLDFSPDRAEAETLSKYRMSFFQNLSAGRMRSESELQKLWEKKAI